MEVIELTYCNPSSVSFKVGDRIRHKIWRPIREGVICSIIDNWEDGEYLEILWDNGEETAHLNYDPAQWLEKIN